MFSSLLSSLQSGKLPDSSQLKKRFDLAIIKKNGVLSLPYHFWQNDPKINPLSSHMLWAAILLEDDEALAVTLDFIHKEAAEPLLIKGNNLVDEHDREAKKKLSAYIAELRQMVQGKEIDEIIETKCRWAEVLIGIIDGGDN